MKLKFKNTILEGAPKRGEKEQLIQTISIVSELTKDSGDVIQPLTDTIDVVLTSDSISQCEADIEKAAQEFLDKKYSG